MFYFIQGLQEALDWLRENFADAADDLDSSIIDDDETGIPLVPILDCAVEAMENQTFLNLLKAFGIQEPYDEQVCFFIK